MITDNADAFATSGPASAESLAGAFHQSDMAHVLDADAFGIDRAKRLPPSGSSAPILPKMASGAGGSHAPSMLGVQTMRKAGYMTDRMGRTYRIMHSEMPPPNKDYRDYGADLSNRQLERCMGADPRGDRRKTEVKGTINAPEPRGDAVDRRHRNYVTVQSKRATFFNRSGMQPQQDIDTGRDMYDGHNMRAQPRAMPLEHCWRESQQREADRRAEALVPSGATRAAQSTARRAESAPFAKKPAGAASVASLPMAPDASTRRVEPSAPFANEPAGTASVASLPMAPNASTRRVEASAPFSRTERGAVPTGRAVHALPYMSEATPRALESAVVPRLEAATIATRIKGAIDHVFKPEAGELDPVRPVGVHTIPDPRQASDARGIAHGSVVSETQRDDGAHTVQTAETYGAVHRAQVQLDGRDDNEVDTIVCRAVKTELMPASQAVDRHGTDARAAQEARATFVGIEGNAQRSQVHLGGTDASDSARVRKPSGGVPVARAVHGVESVHELLLDERAEVRRMQSGFAETGAAPLAAATDLVDANRRSIALPDAARAAASTASQALRPQLPASRATAGTVDTGQMHPNHSARAPSRDAARRIVPQQRLRDRATPTRMLVGNMESGHRTVPAVDPGSSREVENTRI